MSNWISITPDTLNEAGVAAALSAYSTAAKATGQDDRAPGLIQGVIDEIRMAVATHRANGWDADETTIPKSLKRFAVIMIIAELKNALEDELTKSQQDALEYARKQIALVREGKLLINAPDTAETPDVPATSTIETLVDGATGTSREEMAGL
jgi:hypothetical protein